MSTGGPEGTGVPLEELELLADPLEELELLEELEDELELLEELLDDELLDEMPPPEPPELAPHAQMSAAAPITVANLVALFNAPSFRTVIITS